MAKPAVAQTAISRVLINQASIDVVNFELAKLLEAVPDAELIILRVEAPGFWGTRE